MKNQTENQPINKVTEEVGFEELSLISQGHAAFQILKAGIELNVFQTIEHNPGVTLVELAKKLNLELQPAKILIFGLASLKIIKKDGDAYVNSNAAKIFLLPESPANMLDILGWQSEIVYPGIVDFTQSLKENRNVGLRRFPGNEDNLYLRLRHDPDLELVFQKAMSSLSKANNRILIESANFSDVTHLVDAGGGDGTNAIAIAIAKKHPHLKVTIFDNASVC